MNTETKSPLPTDPKVFYRVEQDDYCVCNTCHQDAPNWTIVSGAGEEECGIGQSWGDKETADDICDLMNMAFVAGQEHEHRYVKEPASPLGYVCACGEYPPVGWYPESTDV